MLIIDIQQKTYGKAVVMENFHSEIPNNGIYGVVGKNGSGKTTFFKCLCHLTAFSGNIRLNEKKLVPAHVAFLPTEPYLYEHLTVKEFYRFFSKLINIKNTKNHFFDINADLMINELSTGMRKKVYLNALLQKTYSVYIFDEPFNGLDIESAIQLRNKITELSQNNIVFVASHILETLKNCKKIFLLQKDASHEIFDFFNQELLEDKLTKN